MLVLALLLAPLDASSAFTARDVEGVILSPAVSAPLYVGWSVTTRELLADRNQFYGDVVGREKIGSWSEHLHVGCGLHMAGFVTKHRYPALYESLSPGARALMCSGSLIQLDDMYQHLYLHKHDAYDLNRGLTGQIAQSPLHRLYETLERPERDENLKVMLELMSLSRFTVSVGYYQGMAGEVSCRITSLQNERGALQWKNIVGVGSIVQNGKKHAGLEQAVTGLAYEYYLRDWCAIEVGSGLRLCSNNPLLSDKFVTFYGIRLGTIPLSR
ncbi:MAG: hypothetical protein V2A71_07130 [Candidatus Eisenbacteria bacterium]